MKLPRKTSSLLPALKEEEEDEKNPKNFYFARSSSTLVSPQLRSILKNQSPSGPSLLHSIEFKSPRQQKIVNEFTQANESVQSPENSINGLINQNTTTFSQLNNQKTNNTHSTTAFFRSSMNRSHFSTFANSAYDSTFAPSKITASTVPKYLARLRFLEKTSDFGSSPEEDEQFQRKMSEIKKRLDETLRQKALFSSQSNPKNHFGDLVSDHIYTFTTQTMLPVCFSFKTQDLGSPLVIRLYFNRQSQMNPRFEYTLTWTFVAKKEKTSDSSQKATNKQTVYIYDKQGGHCFSSDSISFSLYCSETTTFSISGSFKEHENIIKKNWVEAKTLKCRKQSFFDETILRMYENETKEQMEERQKRKKQSMGCLKSINYVKDNKEKQGSHSSSKFIEKIHQFEVK